MKEYSHIPDSLRQRVFKLLNKNPLLKPQDICELLHETNRGVITQYKKQWKKEYKSQRGLIRSIPDDVHNAFYKGKLDGKLAVDILSYVRRKNVSVGGGRLKLWRLSKAKNRYGIFKNALGRIRLFENGTVELWVRKPASTGKAMQLFSNAFTWTELIDSIKTIEAFQKTLMIKKRKIPS